MLNSVSAKSATTLFEEYKQERGGNFAARKIVKQFSKSILEEIVKPLWFVQEGKTYPLIRNPFLLKLAKVDEKKSQEEIPTDNLRGVKLYGDWCDGKRGFSSFSDWIKLYHFAESIKDESVADYLLRQIEENPALYDPRNCEEDFLEFLKTSRIRFAVSAGLARVCLQQDKSLKELQESPWPYHKTLHALIGVLNKLPTLQIYSAEIAKIADFFPNTALLVVESERIEKNGKPIELPNLQSASVLSYNESIKLLGKQLASLKIKNPIYFDESYEHLLSFPNLNYLNLNDASGLKEGFFDEIIKLTDLETVSLSINNSLKDADTAKLGQLPNLKEVALTGFGAVGDQTLQALAQNKTVTHLDLSHSETPGLELLKESQSLTHLKLVGNVHLTKGVMEQLGFIKSLNSVDVSFCPNISEEEVEELRKKSPFSITASHIGKESGSIVYYNNWLYAQDKENVKNSLSRTDYLRAIEMACRLGVSQENCKYFPIAIADWEEYEEDEKLFASICAQNSTIAAYRALDCIQGLTKYFFDGVFKTEKLFRLADRVTGTDRLLFKHAQMIRNLPSIEISSLAATPAQANFAKAIFPMHRYRVDLVNLTSKDLPPAYLDMPLKFLNIEKLDANSVGAFKDTLCLQTLQRLHVKISSKEILNSLLDWAAKAPLLRELSLVASADIQGCGPIDRLKGIKELTLSNFALTQSDIEAISSLHHLESLAIFSPADGIQGLDLSPLSKLPNLKHFEIENTTIQKKNLEWLRKSPSLTSLALRWVDRLDEKWMELLQSIPRLQKPEINYLETLS